MTTKAKDDKQKLIIKAKELRKSLAFMLDFKRFSRNRSIAGHIQDGIDAIQEKLERLESEIHGA